MFKLSEERSKELVRLYCMDIYDKEFSDELKERTYTKRKYYSCSMDTWVEISRNSDLIINLIRDDGYFENIKVDDNYKLNVQIYCDKFKEDFNKILTAISYAYGEYKYKVELVENRIKNKIFFKKENLINSLPYPERFNLRLSQRIANGYKEPTGFGLTYAKSFTMQRINGLKCMYKSTKEELLKLDYLNTLPTTKEDIIKFENDIMSKISLLDTNDKIEYITNVYSKMLTRVLLKDNLDDMPTVNTDRDRLEFTIVMVELSHGFLRSVKTKEEFDMDSLEWSPLMYHLAKIKVDLFGKEIFSELGLGIIGRNDDGDYLIRDNNSIN